jgi:N-acetyl-gamma-glutamyl-phosphate reductase
MVKVGILGAAGYTGGELIRLLINHPEAEIVFANSESNAGNLVAEVHEGLYGETDLKFTAEMPFDQVDVIFFCFGHGKSEAFLKEHNVPESVKTVAPALATAKETEKSTIAEKTKKSTSILT